MQPPVSRRQFLQGASALGAAAVVGACTSSGESANPTTTTAPKGPTADGTLVVITLYGGNDALNTVAPVNDARYRALRGDLALDPATTHDLGEGFALHPSLARCKDLWDRDQLAVVHGVGFGTLDRSHFHCMDVWQAGSEDDTSTGWIGRWLDAVATGPLDAIAVGRGLPLIARGAHRAASVVPPGPFVLPGDDALRELLATLSGKDAGRSDLGDLAARSTGDLLTVAATVSPLVADSPESETLAARLDTVATLIDSELPARAYLVDLGGFDTHSAQAADHARLLGELDSALGAFLDRTATKPVTVLVYSEFGRRVEPNASAGTDHGQAGTVLLAGKVRAGHHGDPPPLDRLADGDLATTVDLRAVYAAVLEGVLGIEAADVLERPPAALTLV